MHKYHYCECCAADMEPGEVNTDAGDVIMDDNESYAATCECCGETSLYDQWAQYDAMWAAALPDSFTIKYKPTRPRPGSSK